MIMARRNDKKLSDLMNARTFVQLVIDQLDRYGKTKQQNSALENCIKQLPALSTQPALRRRYLDMINHVIKDKYSPNVVLTYFQREDSNLRAKIAEF